MDNTQEDPNLNMVMRVKQETSVSLRTLIELAARYAGHQRPDSCYNEQATQLTNHGVIPPDLIDMALDYLSGRIAIRDGINPETENRCVWIVKL